MYVLGKSFAAVRGVTQGRVLSLLLFSFYTDDLITELNSGLGVYIAAYFVVVCSMLISDDIILLSGSCTCIQQMVNICVAYDLHWDVSFNP